VVRPGAWNDTGVDMAMGTPLDDAREVLAEAAVNLKALKSIYEQSLEAKRLVPGVRPKVKSILEHQRSALDYLAHELVTHYGVAGKKSYYPMAPTLAEVTASVDSRLPGVRSDRPDIATAIEARQPCQPGYEWLTALTEHVNALKHRELTPQTRQETVVRSHTSPGGGGVRWTQGVTFGAGVYINGVPVDPRTQTTVDGRTVQTIYVDWLFDGTTRSVLGTLQQVQAGVEGILNDIGALVGW
jgi:hypothetical protein